MQRRHARGAADTARHASRYAVALQRIGSEALGLRFGASTPPPLATSLPLSTTSAIGSARSLLYSSRSRSIVVCHRGHSAPRHVPVLLVCLDFNKNLYGPILQPSRLLCSACWDTERVSGLSRGWRSRWRLAHLPPDVSHGLHRSTAPHRCFGRDARPLILRHRASHRPEAHLATSYPIGEQSRSREAGMHPSGNLSRPRPTTRPFRIYMSSSAYRLPAVRR